MYLHCGPKSEERVVVTGGTALTGICTKKKISNLCGEYVMREQKPMKVTAMCGEFNFPCRGLFWIKINFA